MKKNIEEREVNLIDMFWTACLKWRQILLGGIILAILAGGVSFWKSTQEAKIASEQTEKVTLEDIKLDVDSKRNVDVYLKYLKMYEQQKIYNEQAPFMQLDANRFYRSVISFYVDNHFAVEYPVINKTNNINAILEAYKAELRSEEFAEKLKELSSITEEMLPYSMELIDCSNNYGTELTYDEATGIITVSVYGLDEQMCEEITELVKNTISEGKKEITGKFGIHDISLVEDVSNCEADNELLKYQKENLDRLAAYSNTLKDMKGKLDEEELAYVETYMRETLEELDNQEQVSVEEDIQKVAINKKNIVIGFIGGIVLVFGVVVLMYLLSNRLRLEDDFEKAYGIKLMGKVVLKSEKRKKWFGAVDNFFDRMLHLNSHCFTEKEAISMVAAGIKIGAKKQDAAKVYITGAMIGKEEKTIIEKLRKELGKTDLELMEGKPILYDAEALERSAEIGTVVLVEHAGVSLYSEIVEEVEVCEHHGIKILGAVVIA